MIKVKRALISVSDKKGLPAFVRGLHALGVEIISTGGTARQIKEMGIPVQEVSDYTGFPEMLDGRVKTLHPKVHGGLLAVREKPQHMEQIKQHGIGLIDMVVVNLYPFESVIQKKSVSMDEAIENIDIGGPSMLRSAAKNFKSVAVVSNPSRYEDVLKELDVNSGILGDFFLFKLAVEAFTYTAKYDTIISSFLNKRLSGEESFSSTPKEVSLQYMKVQDLRYGENPHQSAAFYKCSNVQCGLANIKQLGGKELSYNNFLDLNAALDFIKDFKEPAAVIIKHNNPTGIASDKNIAKAYKDAHSCDPVSAFGGIIGLNRKVDEETAGLIMKSGFMECVISSGFSKEALKMLKTKKNLRLIQINLKELKESPFDFKKVHGGLLLQDKDSKSISANDLKVVTKKKPNKSQIESMLFGWQVIKNVKSNAVILVKGNKVVGIGCGQTSRVESVKIAIDKAGKEAKNSILISDAFIPKTDNIEIAANAGIKAVIQTGGSIADDDVVKEADKRSMAMVFTGVRHFKH